MSQQSRRKNADLSSRSSVRFLIRLARAIFVPGRRPMNRGGLIFVVGIILLVSGARSLDAQAVGVCGNGIRETGEQCDDANGDNLDGCSSQCKFEQNQRINQLKLQFATSTSCARNAFGSAFKATAQLAIQGNLDNSIASGTTSIVFAMIGLDDLSGTDDPAVEVGIVNGTPLAALGVTYNGNNDLDWWYAVDPLDIDGSRTPTSRLSGSIASKILSAGPGSATLVMNVSSSARWRMSSLRVTATNGDLSTPLLATGAAPPGHLASENLDPALASYGSSGAGIAGELCGNVNAASLAAMPAPVALINGSISCVEGYTATSSLLDVIVGGCRVLGGLITAISPTQPDQEDPNVLAAGAGPPYRLTLVGSRVTGCRDKNSTSVDLNACLNDAAYSSFFKFSTDRVITTRSCPTAPIASNNGPICASRTLELTATGPSGNYQWAGPNGFTSNLQSPTISGATTAASGNYSVTVTLAGCTSPAGMTTVAVGATPATPVITAPSSVAAGATGVTASVIAHEGSAYAWTIMNGTITGGQGTNQITFTAGLSGTVNLGVVETSASCPSAQATTSLPIGVFGPPQNLIATASSSGQVAVTWTASAGASGYEVVRRQPGGMFALLGSTTGVSFNDLTVTGNKAYLYMVRAIDGSNNRSADSNADLATTVIFTDDPLVAQITTVKASHVSELRAAVGAVRNLANLSPWTFMDPTLDSNVLIKTIHVSELRAALEPARSGLALPALSYSDAPLVAGMTAVKAAHLHELRNGAK